MSGTIRTIMSGLGEAVWWIYAIATVGAFIFVPVYMWVHRVKDRKMVYAARDALNARFAETGAPARYACPYTEWDYVEEYNDDPAEAAVRFMKESLEEYNRYLEAGGDPEAIDDVKTLWRLKYGRTQQGDQEL